MELINSGLDMLSSTHLYLGVGPICLAVGFMDIKDPGAISVIEI